MIEVLVPVFRVADARASARWYGRLGFEVVAEHRFGEGFPLYVILDRGGIPLHLSEHSGDAPPRSLVYVWVDDVDAVAAEFGEDVVDEPWAREVELTDPDGNRLRVGQRR